MDINELTGVRIKELRTEMGIDANSLAIDLGVSKSTLSKIENGKIDISLSRVQQIAEVLKVPLNSLIPNMSSPVQINKDHACNNINNVSTQINHSDPSIKELLIVLIQKLSK